MLLSAEGKDLATRLRSYSTDIFEEISAAFEDAVVGCQREVQFLRDLVVALDQRLGALRIPDARFSCRHVQIHQKPIVSTPEGDCELGDLLVVVKYQLLDFTSETTSVIYQVKLADRGTTSCSIDQTQLNLLKNWPPFEFGSRKRGGRQSYIVQPQTVEFGSYMLQPRDVDQGSIPRYWGLDPRLTRDLLRLGWRPTYGVCPTAWQCYDGGPTRVDLRKLAHVPSDASALLSLILFKTGEHNSNASVQRLVSALYRYAGLAPDPPEEFRGDGKEFENDGFAILEITVTQDGEGLERQDEGRWEG